MTARATYTQAELARAIRAADACGKVALVTPAGIAFVESGRLVLPSPDQPTEDSTDRWFSKREGRRERRP